MKIAILGYGLQGQSAYEYWNKDDNEVTICDANPDVVLPDGVARQLGEYMFNNLDQFDLLIRTPALHPKNIVQAGGEALLQKVTTVTNEFFRVCPTKNIVAITGTKGKGTTSTLIAKMLEAAGKRVHLGGNIGTPPLELLKNNIQPSDYVVLELANYQLIDITHSPHIAICLMIEPEHLNWHADLHEYIEAKQQLFRWQKPEDIAIYFASNEHSKEVVSPSPGRKIAYMSSEAANVVGGAITIAGQEVIQTSELKLLGQHNWQNICAAITAVWQIAPDSEPIRKVLASFSGLEHRLELVRELDGVKYYDDSFGTTPGTAKVAIESFNEPKILILGGSDKGATYDELADAVVKNNVKHVLLIGQQADRIQAALDEVGYKSYSPGGENMDEIAANAKAQARPGDVVLLSTACASFDMFKNFKDRGEQFKAAVQSL